MKQWMTSRLILRDIKTVQPTVCRLMRESAPT
jgi:hypothetical protein